MKHQQALAAGFRRAIGKMHKITSLGITPTMTEDEVDNLIEVLAKAKGEAEGKDWKTFIKGQRWYVEELVKVSGMEPEEQLEYEYSLAFPDVANESEMLQYLRSM